MTLFGSDVSHYDAADTRSMLDDGIMFQTHKAGGDQIDSKLYAWWNCVKGYRSQGKLLGAYWVLYPGNPAYRADLFLARLDAVCPGWRDGPFLLQVDCEIWNGDRDTMPSIGEINVFCDRLAGAMPKLNPVVYAPKWCYGDSVSALRYPIWASSYVTGAGHYHDLYPGDGAKQWAAYGDRGPTILQYSSSATIGGQTTCDVNAFRGTMQQLINVVAPGWKASVMAQLDQDDYTNIAKAIIAADINPDPAVSSSLGGTLWTTYNRTGILNNLGSLLNSQSDAEAKTIATAVLAGIANQAENAAAEVANLIEQALPTDLAKQVVDELAARVQPRAE